MPSLKDLRNRIAATKATQKITKAMQMVAVSKLRRAQAAAEAARPYANHMDQVLDMYKLFLMDFETEEEEEKPDERIAAALLTLAATIREAKRG